MKNIILLLSIFSFTSTTYAVTTSGTVTDSQSGEPISGTSVVFRPIERNKFIGSPLATAVTKADGNFSFDVVIPGKLLRHAVVVSAEGYDDGQDIIRLKTGPDGTLIKETLTSNIALGLQTELKLIDYGIVTANGDNIIKSGILTDIEVRIQNRGQGIAEDIRFKIRFVKGVYLGPDSKKSYNFKTLKAGEFKDLKFSFKPSKNVKNIIHIYIDYIEKSNSGTFTIQLEVGKPQKSIKEFVVEGSKLYFNDVEIPQWVDDVGQEYPTIDILTQYKKYMEYCERENKSVIKSEFELWIAETALRVMEVEIINEREQNIISHFYNPNLLIYPTDYYWYDDWGGRPKDGISGWFKFPFEEASVRIEGLVFGKKTGVTFEFGKRGVRDCGWGLCNIIFDDIPDPVTGSPPTNFRNVIEPEIIENQFQNFRAWKPIQYLSEKNIMLFAYKEYNNSIPIFYLLDLKKGTVESSSGPPQKHVEGYEENQFIFSSRFLGKFLIRISPQYQVSGKLIYYDYLNDKVLDEMLFGYSGRDCLSFEESVENSGAVKLQTDLSWVNDDNLWFRLLSDNFSTATTGRWVKYGYVGEDKFNYVYSISESDVNKKLFEIISDFTSTIKDESIKAFPGDEINITYYFRITESGLVKMFDKYGSIYVFNLNKNGLQERKYSSIQIKNNMLSDEDKQYLEQFDPKIVPTNEKYKTFSWRWAPIFKMDKWWW